MAEGNFKQLSIDNWQQPDPALSAFMHFSPQDRSTGSIDGDEWAREFLAVELSEKAPSAVRRLFAVARGALVYGYFFYPLYTLGLEQLFRVAEAAVGHKCKRLDIDARELERMNFYRRLDYLVREGEISMEAKPEWDTLRQLRNLAPHPDDQTILPPAVAIDILRGIAASIDGLHRE
jgi:hypothetical protein